MVIHVQTTSSFFASSLYSASSRPARGYLASVGVRPFISFASTDIVLTDRSHSIIVSVPVDLSSPSDAELAKLEGKGVKGRYVVIERVMETESGNTEWCMATTGTAGGNLPQVFVEQAMASKVSNVNRRSFFPSLFL